MKKHMKETRVTEIRANEPKSSDGLVLSGVPIVYDKPAVINAPFGNYIEVIKRGALDHADISDVRLLYNHDMNKIPLARTPKTMHLEIGTAGLSIRADLPDTEDGRSVHTAVKRGDLSGMSFAFKVPKDGSQYNAKTNTRTITKIEKVYECSVVAFPAYSETSVEARSQIENEQQAHENEKLKAQAKLKLNQILRRDL